MEIEEDMEFIPGPEEEAVEEPVAGPEDEIISTDQWFWTFVISAIPIIGQIMLFVWAFGSNTNPNKRNWARASLLMLLIVIVFYIIIIGFFFGSSMSVG